MTLTQWVKQFSALGCSSVLIDAWLRYKPFPHEGRFAWIEAEPHEEGITERPHRILIRPGAVEPFLVIWHPDETFLHSLRRSRFEVRSVEPTCHLLDSRLALARLVQLLQERPLQMIG